MKLAPLMQKLVRQDWRHVPTERVPERELLHTGAHVRCEIPSGNSIDLDAKKDEGFDLADTAQSAAVEP